MNQPVIICSNCRAPNPARNLYCQSCGKPLIPASPPAPGDVTQPSAAQGYSPQQPEQPYSPSPMQQYPAPPASPGSAAPGTEYPPQPPQGYQQQGMPPAYTTPPVQQTGVPPIYEAMPLEPGTAQSYATAQPKQDFFQKSQNRIGAFFSGIGRQSYPVKTGTWSAVVNGGAERAAELEQAFVNDFNRREVSYVDLAQIEMTSGLMQRGYQVARHRAGSVAAYFNAAGRDLMVGWEMSVQQKPNWTMIIILALIAIFGPFFTNLVTGWSFGRFLVLWIFGIFGYILPLFVAAAITGNIIKGDIWALFIEKPDPAAQQELSALANVVQQSLHTAVKNAGLEEKTL